MRGEHNGIAAVRVMQCARLRRLEHEFGKPVVNEVNLQLTEPQRAASERKFTRVCNDSIDVVRGEQPLKQKEFRV